MGDISAFPTIRNVLVSGDNIQSYTAGGTIVAGQVVAIHGTGVSQTVHAAVKGTTDSVVGVAIYGATTGAKVAVAGPGCRVYCANADDTATFDAGDYLEDNDNAVGGTVSVAARSDAGAVAVLKFCVGVSEDDVAASGTGIVRLICGPITSVNTA
jgi:hypothetical protein